MNGNQKKIGLLVAVICTAIVLIVFAAVHTLKSVNNNFVPAEVAIAIIENDTQLSSNDNYIKLDENKGSENFTATKKVCIKNTGGSNPVPVYTRVCIFPKFTNINGSRQIEKLSGFPATISGKSFTMGDVTFYLDEDWNENWQYKDNYFYYIGKGDSKAGVLAVGATTAPLLESVSIKKDTYQKDYTDKGAYLKVVVLADSIQTVGNAVEKRWNNLESNDAERPDVSTDEESTTVTVFSLAQRRATDTTTSDSAVMPVTQYEMNRVQNMISSTTASVIYQPPEGDWASDFEDELKKNNILEEDKEEETEVAIESESQSPSVGEEY